MEAQLQIRQNAVEMQEYMKELFDWEQSIKKKERAQAAAATRNASSSGAPAPRGRANAAAAPAAADLMQPALGPKGAAPRPAAAGATAAAAAAADKPRTAAAHTYSSYSKWDRFDVDAALASDDEGAPAAARPVGPTPTSTPSTGAASTAAVSPAAAAAAPPAAPIAPPEPAAAAAAATIATRDTLPPDDLLRPVSTTRTAPAAPAAPPTGAAPSTSAPTERPLPPIRSTQPTTPDAWRTRGNDLFKVGEFEGAHECYSRSVELQPTCLAHANRAMALLKLGRWAEAEQDCTAALELDPSYVKAYQRRAAAQRQLGRGLEAARDWEEALRLEPENRTTAADRDAAIDHLLREQKLQPPSRRTAVPVAWPAPPPPTAARAQQAAAARREEAPAAAAGAGGAGGDPLASAAAASGSAAPQELGGREAGEAGPRTNEARAAASTSSPAAPAARAPTPTPAASASSSGGDTGVRARLSVPVLAAAASASGAAPRGPPKTSAEFEAAWRSMAGDSVWRASYLSCIPPASLPALLKTSLTGPLLTDVVRCVLEGIARTAAAAAGGQQEVATAGAGAEAAAAAVPLGFGVELLEALTRVQRFELMVMSVPSRDRAALRGLWDGAAAQAAPGAGGHLQERLAALRPKFRL